TVADVGLLLSAMAGADDRCPISIEQAPAHFAESLNRDFKGTRVAWFKNLGGVIFDARIRDAVDAQRRTFESLGCIVEEAEPDLSGGDEAFNILRAWGYASQYGELARTHRDQIKETVLWEIDRGSKLSAADIHRAHALHSQVWDRMRVFQKKYE